MTDFRGIEQELWDDEESAGEDRHTLVIPQKAPTVEPDVSGGATGLALSVSTGTQLLESKASTTATGSVDSVARFIAEPGLLAPSAERELDAPRRSLAALELLDAEYGAEPTEKRLPPLPPALPAGLRPRDDLPSMLLGPQISTRHDITERMNAIPMTHPLANSIAPGGSPVTTPPAALPKRPLRAQLALGALALVVIGAGASGFLQSYGEHHAASGRGGSEDDDVEQQTSEARRDDAKARQSNPPHASEQAHLQHAARTLGDPQVASTPQVSAAPSSEPVARAPATPAPSPESAGGARKLRIAVGGAQLRPRARASVAPSETEPAPGQGPDRQRIVAAMTALTPELRQCVGDEHGVADVTLTVRAPGVVSHALVEGAFAGSDKGSCIARALRTAKLPPFEEPVLRVAYPFQL